MHEDDKRFSLSRIQTSNPKTTPNWGSFLSLSESRMRTCRKLTMQIPLLEVHGKSRTTSSEMAWRTHEEVLNGTSQTAELFTVWMYLHPQHQTVTKPIPFRQTPTIEWSSSIIDHYQRTPPTTTSPGLHLPCKCQSMLGCFSCPEDVANILSQCKHSPAPGCKQFRRTKCCCPNDILWPVPVTINHSQLHRWCSQPQNLTHHKNTSKSNSSQHSSSKVSMQEF